MNDFLETQLIELCDILDRYIGSMSAFECQASCDAVLGIRIVRGNIESHLKSMKMDVECRLLPERTT